MYQYSRAIYRSIKDLIDPYVDDETRIQYRREVLGACEQTMERLAKDPLYFAKPDRALFQDIRRYFPITCQAQVAWAVREGVAAAVAFIEGQIEAGAFDGGVAPRRATTRQGQPCQRTPPPEGPSRASAPRCRIGTTARRISISSVPRSRRSPARPDRVVSPRVVARHGQADPSALARRLLDGGAAGGDRTRYQGSGRGLPGDVRRGVRSPVLLRPGRVDRPGRPAPLAARRVHGRGALQHALGELFPAAARAHRRRARGAPDLSLPARGQVRLRRAASPGAAEPRPRPPGLRGGADRHRDARRSARS